MPARLIPYLKVVAHLICLWPLIYLLHWYRSGQLAADADPVSSLTHFTGDWALWILLLSLAITPIRRLHPALSGLIRFRRLIGLYAFFYATLHLLTYAFLFSGYDLPTAWAGLHAGHPGVVAQQWRAVWPTVKKDLLTQRFMQVGLGTWILLLLLALTSPVAILRRMGGRNWQRLHRFVYLAAALACLHFWLTVKRGVLRPMPDTVILTVLLLARLAWTLWNRRRPSRRPAPARGTAATSTVR